MPNDEPEVLHRTATVVLSRGVTSSCAVALQELQKAVTLSPEEGYEKYMYLGQLLQGEQALAATQKGVELLQLVGMMAAMSLHAALYSTDGIRSGCCLAP